MSGKRPQLRPRASRPPAVRTPDAERPQRYVHEELRRCMDSLLRIQNTTADATLERDVRKIRSRLAATLPRAALLAEQEQQIGLGL